MRIVRMIAAAVLFAAALRAHVGTADVYMDAKAGPYQLFITVQPPPVIPGVAQVQVRVEHGGAQEISAAPLAMTGAGARYAPTPDSLEPSKEDAQYFTGALWLMSTGSAQIRLTVKGAGGNAAVSVPLPAVAQRTETMQAGLGVMLSVLMIFLVLGLVAICGAAVREAPLEPGATPDARQMWRSRWTMAGVLALLAGVIWLGRLWWNSDAAAYREQIYKPLRMEASLSGARALELKLSDPGWMVWRKVDDLIPDHNHLMHLYALREPGLDAAWHLHPALKDTGRFELALPTMPAGRYRLYADVVHENGFPETMVAAIDLPEIRGESSDPDDAGITARPVTDSPAGAKRFTLPDGGTLLWTNAQQRWRARHAELFTFELLDANGKPPSDMQLYMGMLGHAAFVNTDGTVFAHIHPNGSVAMAALMMTATAAPTQQVMAMPGMEHGGMEAALPNKVSFPFGFPKPGRYRIVVQMKHGGRVETGIFDADVE